MSSQPSIIDLAKRGEYKFLEDNWLSLIEQSSQYRDELLEALSTLSKKGRVDLAATLGWTWLSTEKEKLDDRQALTLGRDLMICCGDSEEMRNEALNLYREVYGDRAELETLITASGITGEKSPRRALRTLDICLNLKEGDYLLGRSSEEAAEVTEVDPDNCEYTIRNKRGIEDTLDADTLALKYDPVPPHDFRALAQLHPDKITELSEVDPVALVIGVLHSHQNRLDAEELQHILSPRWIPADKWSGWWSKARTQLKKSRNVVLEGRNPVILTYHAKEQTLEDEFLPIWEAADSALKRLNVVDAYFREARGRNVKIDPDMIQRMHKELLKRIKTSRKGAPGHALAEALVIDRMVEEDALSENQEQPAREIIAEQENLQALLLSLHDNKLILRTLPHIQALNPDTWPTIFQQILLYAPVEACSRIAEELDQAEHRDLLKEAVETAVQRFENHINTICWLWKTRWLDELQPLPARDMLIRILDHLGNITRDEMTPPHVLKNAREQIRAAMSAEKYRRYREVIKEMEPGLASTIRTTTDRLDSLGQTVRANMMKIVVEYHPTVGVVKPKYIDPWKDDDVIYTSQRGFNRRREEIDFLRNVKIPENAKAIGEAASRGDLSENSEYKFALEERDLLQARLNQLQSEMSIAELVNHHDVSNDKVGLGNRIILKSTDGSSQKQIIILGPFDTDIEQGVYNYRAPLCGKLRGLKIGDKVTLEIGDGEKEYRVEEIANALAEQR